MIEDNIKIAVVVPAYKVSKHIVEVIKGIPNFVDHIIIVDDKCPELSGHIAQNLKDERTLVLYHAINQGVGGAVISGYKKALELNVDIVVKVDGDGQMDPLYMFALIKPIIEKKADYTKGNRFVDFRELVKMPKIRLFGNSGLSFLVKVASGYWNIMDPTNGYTAISAITIKTLELDSIAKRYFFESDMLINLNIDNVVVKDVNIPAKYGTERSSLSVSKVLLTFPVGLFKGFAKRIFFKYYLYDFNMFSVYFFIGFPMLLFGAFFGLIKWHEALDLGVEASTGTVMLSVLPIILGTQFLLQAIQIDMDSIPKKTNE